MKSVTRALLACALPLAIPAGAAAQKEIVVRSPPSLAKWSAGMSRELGREVAYPRPGLREGVPEGVVRVRFGCAEDGKPAGAAVWKGSGDRRLDKAALAGVNRIRSMHPLPEGLGPDQRYQAVIVFAASDESYDRRMRGLKREFAASGRPAAGRAVAMVGPIQAMSR